LHGATPAAPDGAGNGLAVAEEGLAPRHVEEGLVERERLDQWREAPEDVEGLLAGRLVAIAMGRHHDGLGCPP